MQEPDEHCKLNVGLMKELTGGDKIVARALFREPIEFKPQFKMVLTCNEKPILPPNDEGTWRRIILVEFNSRFKHDPRGEYNVDNVWIPESSHFPEFPIDESLNEKFDDWAEPFMSILINMYTLNKHIDLREPKEVREYTEKYREQNDHFKEFINDRIILDPTNTYVIKIETLFQEYKLWFKDNHGSSHGQKKQRDLKDFMDKEFANKFEKGNNKKRRGYCGIRIINHEVYENDIFNTVDELN